MKKVASMTESKEERFFKALEDLFTGVKMEGKSGYVNLFSMKTQYFKRIKPALLAAIENRLAAFPDFRGELFDRLAAFFSRYFSENGSICFTCASAHEDIYARVCPIDGDGVLFWKAQGLYYVKTDVLYRSMKIEADGHSFYFDASSIVHKKNNEKRDLAFVFKEIRAAENGKLIVLTAFYAAKDEKSWFEGILRAIARAGIRNCTAETLAKAIRVFKKQSEVDFFINQDARGFLREQFDLWIYQHLFKAVARFNAAKLGELQVLRESGYKIIDDLARFEDELVKVWNKPKFALNSGYVITQDRLPHSVVRKLVASEGIAAQIEEWIELGIVREGFAKEEVEQEEYRYLPFDTKYFKELEPEILGQFADLDESLDGWLIHSENYQALHTILPKFKEKVKCIYIDPPYNTGSEAFHYLDRYKDGTWLTMMENRLRLAAELMRKDGVIFVSIDDNQAANLKKLLASIFPLMPVTYYVQVRYAGKTLNAKSDYQKLIEQVLCAQKEGFEPYKGRENYEIDKFHWEIIEKSKQPRRITLGGREVEIFYAGEYEIKKVAPHLGGLKETWASGSVLKGNASGKFFRDHLMERTAIDGLKVLYKVYGIGEDGLGYRYFTGPQREGATKGKFYAGIPLAKKQLLLRGEKASKEIPVANFYDFADAFGNCRHEGGVELRNGKKPEKFIRQFLEIATREGDLVLDFFAGTGSTCATALKMGRKFIAIENDEGCFVEKLKRRMVKVLSGEQTGISAAVNWRGGGFFKYFALEQYEDVLQRAAYKHGVSSVSKPDQGACAACEAYVFMGDEAMSACGETLDGQVDLSQLYDRIDLAETLSCITGKWIKQITAAEVEFADGTRGNLRNPDGRLIKPLIWW